MLHEIEIVAGEMVLLDADGNGCECHRLVGYRDAKKKVQEWTRKYTLDVAECYRSLNVYFSGLDDASQQP